MNENLRMINCYEHGQNRGNGSLLGIQPFMERGDYASEAAFYARLEGYFQQAFALGWLGDRTIVILPEYVGTWLVALQGAQVLQAATVQAAMQPLALRKPLAFMLELARAKEKDRATAAMFRTRAEMMAQAYQSVFSRLARAYRVTIVAGSILLPAPFVVDGQVRAGKGPVYNASFLFQPDGRADPQISLKCFPIQSELPFVTPARVDDLPAYETPAGRLGVLVCADSWFPAAYQRMKDLGVELLAVPSASSHREAWYRPWNGYSGWPEAGDVARGDIGSITEQEAWGKYALAGRITSCGARVGIKGFPIR